MTSDERLPPKASLMRKGSEMHDKSQVDIEGEPKTKPKLRVDDDHGETSSTLDPETWALPYVRPKRWKVAARKRRSKPTRTTLRWKWLSVE